MLYEESNYPNKNIETNINEDFVSLVNDLIPGLADIFQGECENLTRERSIFLAILRTSMGSTPEKARQCMKTIDHYYRLLFIKILEQLKKSDKIKEEIDEKIIKLSNIPSNKAIIPSATGTKNAEGKISTQDSINFQLNMIRNYLSILKKNNCLPYEVNFAVDPTHIPKVTKRLPRFTRYIVKGQQITRQKGMRADDIYDTTNGINLMSFFPINRKVGTLRTKIPEWIEILESIIKVYSEFGIKIVNIFGDREYSNGYNYGPFSNGKLVNSLEDYVPIRLVEPTKFYSDNPKKSLEELNISDWRIDTIKLYQKDVKSYMGLMKYLAEFYEVKQHGNIHVPVLKLAFYEDNGEFMQLSESPFAEKISKIVVKIEKLNQMIEDNYNDYQHLIRNHNPAERTKNKWLYKRKNNKKFKTESDVMYNLWFQAIEWKSQVDKLVEKSRKLRKKLRFYTVSITKEELDILENGHHSTIKGLINKIIQACYEYHQRWGIENYFAFLKREILYIGKTRSINWMNVQWLQAQLIYNAYVISRTIRITSEKRKRAPRWRPTDSKNKTQKKHLETKDYNILSFNQFINEILGKCLQFRLEQIYT